MSDPAAGSAVGTAPDPRLAAAPYAMLLAVMLLWASNVVVGRFVAGSWSPYALSLWRWAAAFVALLPLGAVPLWRHRALLRRHAGLILLLGTLSVGLFPTLLFVALNYTSAINVALINSTTPIAILLLTRLLLGAPMAPRVVLGVGLGLAGAAIVIVRGDPAALLALRFNLGDLLQLGAVLCWALYSVLMQRHPLKLPPLAFQLAMVAVGLPLLAAVCAIVPLAGATVPRHLPDVGLILFLAIFVSIGSTVLWNLSVGAVGARVASFFNYLTPPLVALMSVIFLDEELRPFHAVGFVVVIAGVLLATLASRPQAAR